MHTCACMYLVKLIHSHQKIPGVHASHGLSTLIRGGTWKTEYYLHMFACVVSETLSEIITLGEHPGPLIEVPCMF